MSADLVFDLAFGSIVIASLSTSFGTSPDFFDLHNAEGATEGDEEDHEVRDASIERTQGHEGRAGT